MHETTSRRAKLRSALAVLGAATLLVGGIQLVATAATGGPLLLGKSNTADKTTKLKTTGNKAALSLKSKSGKAPLKVSNSTLIKKFNADLVDGKSLEQISPTRYLMTVGTSNTTTGAASSQFVATTALPPGTYEASMGGIIEDTNESLACFFVDYTKLTQPVPDASGYVMVAFMDTADTGVDIGSNSVTTIVAGHQMLFGCNFGNGTLIASAPHVVLQMIDSPSPAPGVAPFVPRGAGGRALDKAGIR